MKKIFTISQSYKPGLTLLSKKRSGSLILLLFLAFPFVSPAQTIWNSGSQVFLFAAPGQQDCMTAQTCLTRVTVLYNSVCQTVSGNQGCGYLGPCNTEWAVGDIADWNTLTYQRLYLVNNCSPGGSILGTPLVLHLIAENIYLQLTFNSWNAGTNGSFFYTRTTLSTLPILLSEFSGRKTGNINMLNWTSSTEDNFSHYNIQRSTNGTDFITLGQVNSKAINGNSSTELHYSFGDTHPALGHNNYRLEMVDKDGQKRYSQVIDLFNSNNGSIVISQNDASDLVNIYISSTKKSTATVKLADMSGRIMRTINARIEKGINNLQLSLDNLAVGIYLIQVYEDAGLAFTGKVLR